MSAPGEEDLRNLEQAARLVAQRIGPVFDQAGAGFALLGFSFGDGGWSTYISNAERTDMIRAFREMADHLEKGLDMPPMRDGEPETA